MKNATTCGYAAIMWSAHIADISSGTDSRDNKRKYIIPLQKFRERKIARARWKNDRTKENSYSAGDRWRDNNEQ